MCVRWLFILILPFWCKGLLASVQVTASRSPQNLRISILTCGPGEDIYSIYGHSAIRIVDSVHQTDLVYNYGTFNFGDPQFVWKFTRGKLDYYLSDADFNQFMEEYLEDGRRVDEQVLALRSDQALGIQQFLLKNLLPENRNYRYDFLFDNCSTRIRDILEKTLGPDLRLGIAMADDSATFRSILNHYERNTHWERFGINLLMSDLVDRKMKSREAMFLPDYLQRGLGGSILGKQVLIASENQLLPQRLTIQNKTNIPLWTMLAFMGCYLLLSRMDTLRTMMRYFDIALFMLVGLLGCFMLFMWFGTDHAVCAWNRNLFWAFPLHLIFAYWLAAGSVKVHVYAGYATWLITLSLIYHFFADQKFELEFLPLIFTLWLRLRFYSQSEAQGSIQNSMHAKIFKF